MVDTYPDVATPSVNRMTRSSCRPNGNSWSNVVERSSNAYFEGPSPEEANEFFGPMVQGIMVNGPTIWPTKTNRYFVYFWKVTVYGILSILGKSNNIYRKRSFGLNRDECHMVCRVITRFSWFGGCCCVWRPSPIAFLRLFTSRGLNSIAWQTPRLSHFNLYIFDSGKR